MPPVLPTDKLGMSPISGVILFDGMGGAGLCLERSGAAEIEGERPCIDGERRDRGISPVGAPIGFAGRLEGNGDGTVCICFAEPVRGWIEGDVAKFRFET